MATSDAELIDEARAMTEYDSDIVSDSKFQELLHICKEELRADFGDPSFSFFQDEAMHAADRALFWFLCIAAKIRTGEIGGMNIRTGEIESSHPAQVHHKAAWFDNFIDNKRKAERQVAGATGPSQTAVTRDNRSYGDQ